ncbi:MAG TPA: M20/M25/M40 family metallo-hydrolase, partial [Candidatus Polarisedimenticolaceae bacterium]|nr:M20/M25/M40 family metallo-hydrolase [Candidatus Polarisedimenticolaceae bacterium]
EGDEPTNTTKGRWPIVGSPLSVTLDTSKDVPPAPLALRPPLAQLPPSFSEERMMTMVRALAAPAAKGRGLGTPELDTAADTIASVMKGVGLEPAGDAHSFFQRWQENGAPLRNVVGMLRGTKKEWESEATVVSAHYDHLGEGHPGADDNASGVAVLLDLARAMVASGQPQRTVIFAAFTGEESGLLGSKRFLATWPKDKTITSNVNLDTVGRMSTGGLAVLGTGSADEWVHIVSGAGYVTGITVKAVPTDPGGSDQKTFAEAGIPAVQLFTGAHRDYHAATDTADKVDGPGLVKVASVAKELVAYLAERDKPLTARTGSTVQIAPAPASGRRASLGAIPDYAYSGSGVRIAGAMPGSPAEAAGLEEGDVIVAMDGVKLRNLQEFSKALGARAPGDKVKVRVMRDGSEKVFEATLGAR